jgi:hypothetical protein
MKTAMQELIDEMDIIKGQLWQEGLKDKSTMISDMIKKAVDKLEKEKEQIMDAYCDGAKGGANGNKGQHDFGWVSRYTRKKYYNQKYNQKQHIIDIMKADEDDGLYDLNK